MIPRNRKSSPQAQRPLDENRLQLESNRSDIPTASPVQLFDGSNSPANICVYSFGLGVVFGASVVAAVYMDGLWQLFVYLAMIACFHVLEYLLVAVYNPDKCELDSFLLDHSLEYKIAHVAALVEFGLEYFLAFEFQSRLIRYTSIIGLIIALIGQTVRCLAMITAKKSFTHIVANDKLEEHVLVTTGIYGVVRHPSYTGFCLWSCGTQLMLANPVCFVGFCAALYKFFGDRIEYEEENLVDFFGNDYVQYRRKVYSGIPFIR